MAYGNRSMDAAFVRSTFPPGTRVRHMQTGKHCTMGTKFGRSEFWVMEDGPPAKKGLMSAYQIRLHMEKLNAEAATDVR